LVFWGCHIFKINPQFDVHIKRILLEPNQEPYLFDEEDDVSFYMYVDKIQRAIRGVQIPIIDLDVPVYLFTREKGTSLAKKTVRFQVCIFEKPLQISNMIGVFCNDNVARIFKRALREIASQKVRLASMSDEIQKITPLLPVRFLLREREDEIRKYLPNVRAFSVKKIKDLHIRSASIRGVELENTSEYQRFVKDVIVGGQLSYFGVPVRDRVYNMTGRGGAGTAKIWTRQGRQLPNELPEVDVVSAILSVLNSSQALSVYQI